MEYDPAEMAQLPHLSATSEHYFNTTSAAAYQPTHPLPAGHGATSFLGPAHAPSTSGSGAVSTSTRLDGVPPYSLSINHGNDNDDSNGTGTGPSHNHITVNGNGNGHGKGNGKGNSKGSSKADRTGSSTGAIGVARPPRSRKNRPCDRCRKSKSRCAIGASGPPCSQCSETRKDCTFELAPPVRKPRLQSTAEDGSSLGLGLGSDDVGGLLMGGRDSDTPTRSPSISTPATTAPRKRSRQGQRPRLSSARSRSRSSSVSSGGSESSGDAGGGSLVESGSGRARATARARMSDSVSVSTPQERPLRAGARNGNASGAGAGPSKKAKTKDRRDTNLSGLDVLAAAVPSFDHLANSEYDPHGESVWPPARRSTSVTAPCRRPLQPFTLLLPRSTAPHRSTSLRVARPVLIPQCSPSCSRMTSCRSRIREKTGRSRMSSRSYVRGFEPFSDSRSRPTPPDPSLWS
jgi:hypothetical protein